MNRFKEKPRLLFTNPRKLYHLAAERAKGREAWAALWVVSSSLWKTPLNENSSNHYSWRINWIHIRLLRGLCTRSAYKFVHDKMPAKKFSFLTLPVFVVVETRVGENTKKAGDRTERREGTAERKVHAARGSAGSTSQARRGTAARSQQVSCTSEDILFLWFWKSSENQKVSCSPEDMGSSLGFWYKPGMKTWKEISVQFRGELKSAV